nr:hypothetical protein GCM10020063_009660 [Dactylosporangium thailandense]
MLSGTTLLAVDHTTGTALPISSTVPTGGHTPTTLLSVGGYLYYGQWNPGEVYPVLTRVYKAEHGDHRRERVHEHHRHRPRSPGGSAPRWTPARSRTAPPSSRTAFCAGPMDEPHSAE